MKKIALTLLVSMTCLYGWSQNGNEISERSSLRDRLFFGGNLGAAFGDVTFVEVAPLVGYRVTDKLSAGLQVQYRYRKDKRTTPDLEASDYGFNLFTRYNLFAPFFLQAEYEYLSFEFFDVRERAFSRDGLSSVLLGGGIAQPLGNRGFFVLTALYNITYDDNDLTNPYDSPLVLRAGVNLGF